ncbi:MAG: methyltransferase domain-containing protein [Candidatus Latescibacterota bacterium]
MTLEELQTGLTRCQSLAVCDDFLQANLPAAWPLFYGLTQGQPQKDRRYLDYENVFFAFVNSVPGQAIGAGDNPPASVVALLILFLSLFERAHLYPTINSAANLLPAGPLKLQTEALFQYKNIGNAATDYLDRFDRILALLQEAWDNSTTGSLSEYLLQEYALDSFLEPRAAGIDIRPSMLARFRAPSKTKHYPILSLPSIQKLLGVSADALQLERRSIRSSIMEAFLSQALALMPDSPSNGPAGDLVGKAIQPVQSHVCVPEFLSDQLVRMGAEHLILRQDAQCNFAADAVRNRIYLGTYFPRTVIESWNVFTELLSISAIRDAFRQKDVIRLLDLGSGTGGAVVGTLLALSDWSESVATVRVTSLDANEDALAKQGEILESLREHLPFELEVDLRPPQEMPSDLEDFVPSFSAIADQEGHKYDLITCWKYLCEFYNVKFAPAQGIIRNTLSMASRMLVPYGLLVVSDVTSDDNGVEYFPKTLNREANEHDAAPDAEARTFLPLPCGKSSGTCSDGTCYTQRRFQVSHRLAPHNVSKIAYRVLAPTVFAHSITASFTDLAAYSVNAACPSEACSNGRKREVAGVIPCGYTGFFAEGA